MLGIGVVFYFVAHISLFRLCINMVLGLTLGRSGYTVALVWTGTNSAYFMLKTLSNNYARVGPDESSKALRMPLLWR